MRELKDKVAVVTGAANGIGFSLCERFAKEGMHIVMADLGGAALDKASEQLLASGAKVLAVATDVSKWEDMQNLAAETIGRFGKVNILCNNAGVRSMGSICDTSIEDWRWVLSVDLWGVINGIKAFVPEMTRAGEPGHVVNTASAAGVVVVKNNAPYSVAKFGVVAISEALYLELKDTNAKVGVSVLCPGIVKTNFRENSNRLSPTGAPVASRTGVAPPNELTPAEIAEKVLLAVQDNRFWILPHPELAQRVERRYRGMVDTDEVVGLG